MIGIYKIINNLNGKFYVGQSNDIERRFKEHCSPSRYKRSHIPVDWAIHKYGKENFSLEVLEECSISELNEKEIKWIAELDAVSQEYNCNYGGNSNMQGELNSNAKLSLEDVIAIRIIYNKHSMTQREAYQLFRDKVTWNSFKAVWQGSSWTDVMPEVFTEENKDYYKRKAGQKVNNALSDEEVLSLRNEYMYKSAKELYNGYEDRVAYSSFQNILTGSSYKYLPYYHKKTKTWIYPGEEPKKHPNRCKKVHTTKAYTDEEVLAFRKEYVYKTAKEIYESTDKRITFESFQDMLLKNVQYKNVPVYSKKEKKWIL